MPAYLGPIFFAASMGASYIAPTVEGLTTIDGNHLNPSSSAKWSVAFLNALEPLLGQCLKDVTAQNRDARRPRRGPPI
jgi:hypothetical protein